MGEGYNFFVGVGGYSLSVFSILFFTIRFFNAPVVDCQTCAETPPASPVIDESPKADDEAGEGCAGDAAGGWEGARAAWVGWEWEAVGF